MNTARTMPDPFSLAVLVVDDEPLIRWSVRQGFIERGHRVEEAASAAEAIARVSNGADTFDVVILDLRLPDCDDLSLLDDVRRRSPASHIVMMTAYADDTVRSTAQDHGALAVISKPFQVRALVSLAESSVRR